MTTVTRTRTWKFQPAALPNPGPHLNPTPIPQPPDCFVAFALTRTRIVRVRATSDIESRPVRMRGFVGWGQIPRADKENSIILEVDYVGEPPLMMRFAWFDSTGTPGSYWIPRDVAIPSGCPDLARAEIRALAVFATTTDQAESEALASLLSPPAGASRRAAIDARNRAEEFFFELDSQSDLASTVAPTQQILDVSNLLDQRIQVRISLYASSKKVPLFEPIDPVDLFGQRAALTQVSNLFIKAMQTTLQESTFKTPPGAPRRGDFDWAFELFATDQLGVRYQNNVYDEALIAQGRPNGLPFFQFAELAFCCRENSIYPAFWGSHLETLVRGSHIFAECAPTIIGPYPIPAEEYATVENRRYPRSRLQELRDEYEVKLSAGVSRTRFLADRFTSIVGQAVAPQSGNPVVGTRSPMSNSNANLLIGGVLPVTPP